MGDWVYIKLQPYRQTPVSKRANQKLSTKYFGPYQVIEMIGRVAYRVQLPAEAKIHNVFYISQLKKKIGEQTVTVTWCEFLAEKDEDVRAPVAILEHQLVKRGNRAGVKLLMQWSDSSREEATIGYYKALQKQFPEFCVLNP